MNILQLWIEKASKNLALYIIEHLMIVWKIQLNKCPTWCVDILVTQIYATDKEIVLKALNALSEICENKELMKDLLNKWPQIDKLEIGGDSFLIKLLRSEDGINFLQEVNWVETAIERWLKEENINYAMHIEKSIATRQNSSSENIAENCLQFYFPDYPSLNIKDNVYLY